MKDFVAFDDAVDLLDTDHKAVKKMFIDYSAMCDAGTAAEPKGTLALQICQALTAHSRLEEEIFYPEVRKALGDDALIDQALAEHAGAKAAIADIQGAKPGDAKFDARVKQLGKMIDEHVLEEREIIFLRARGAAMDLKGLVLPMVKRQKQLKIEAAAVSTHREAA